MFMSVFSTVAYKETLTHGTKQLPLQYYEARLQEAVHDFPLHWHEEFELIFIKRGSGIFQINFETYHVKDSDLLIISKGALHEGVGSLMGCECQTIVFHPQFLASHTFDQLQANFLHPLVDNLKEPVVHICSAHPHHQALLTLFHPLLQLMVQKPLGYELIAKGLLLQFFGTLYQLELIKTNPLYSKSNKKFDVIKTIITYIQTHYHESLSVEDVASVVGYSNEHFIRFFKQEIGMKFTDYLNELRLRHAHRLLLQNEQTITDIALACGFENLSYFCKKYKQIYHMTPKQTQKESHC